MRSGICDAIEANEASAAIVQHDPHKCSVAVWRGHEDSEPVYESTHRGHPPRQRGDDANAGGR